ncbi:GyrI-like domain-containing protein [Cohnella boryungensis]|uniref:GyrI-like domain-containing protein n=1 Tax=Cohnella boryungensis TaxID=768479 RepID=A0ABV8S9T2_9BACL
MDYRIVEKEAFTVLGKILRTTCENGENLRQIPWFWQQCNEDGTVDKLMSMAPGKDLLGVCMDMQVDKGEFSYMIACETTTSPTAESFSTRTIPASTWAVFTSVGPLPGTIQSLFGRIYQEWFPAAGYAHSGAPELEVYLPGDTTSEDYRCEVWIPVVKR